MDVAAALNVVSMADVLRPRVQRSLPALGKPSDVWAVVIAGPIGVGSEPARTRLAVILNRPKNLNNAEKGSCKDRRIRLKLPIRARSDRVSVRLQARFESLARQYGASNG